MALAPGTTVGPYLILATLGAGGMGTVYRARDPRLDRDVAIKVSGERFTERFEREARAVAALNHTNICHLYDVGPDYLVMELVEGTALQGPLPLDQALPVLRQLVDALEAAHARGVTHRDLKPDNIRVTPDGVVKVLDFGLAKLADSASGALDPAALTQSPTVASPTMLTSAGMILGTAAYMSPEQARGKPADHRADIWAFGVVAYELLAGKPPFGGESVADVLGAVLHKDPDWTRVPAPLRDLLQWCLEKDRRARLQAIGDARRWLRESADSAAAVSPSPARRPLGWMAATGVATAAALAIAGAWVARDTGPAPLPMRVELSFPEGARPGIRSVPALSPDGRHLAFVATERGRSRLWVRSLDAAEARPLEGTDGAFGSPFWSPDSRTIVYSDLSRPSAQEVRRIDVAGGPSQRLCLLPGDGTTFRGIRGGFWTLGGDIVVNQLVARFFKVPASGGDCTPYGEGVGRYPVLLPDGQHFLYSRRAPGNLARGDVLVGSIELGPLRGDMPVVPNVSDPAAFVADASGGGIVLFIREGTLLAQRLDLNTLSVAGSPVTLADDVGLALPEFSYRLTASASGTVVYQREGRQELRQLAWLDRRGQTLSTVGAPAAMGDGVYLTPDGTRAAYQGRDGQSEDLWIMDLARGVGTRFTTNATSNWGPRWAPDASAVVFSSAQGNREGVRSGGVFMRQVSGADTSERELARAAQAQDWSRDGRFVALTTSEGDLAVLTDPRAGTRGDPHRLTTTPFRENYPRFSPDGRWLLYVSDESGRNELYLQALDTSGSTPALGAARTQVSATGAIRGTWRADGRELLYLAEDGQMTAVDVDTGLTLRVGTPRPLFTMPVFDAWDAAPDGQRFLLAVPVDQEVPPYRVLLNWQGLLPPR